MFHSSWNFKLKLIQKKTEKIVHELVSHTHSISWLYTPDNIYSTLKIECHSNHKSFFMDASTTQCLKYYNSKEHFHVGVKIFLSFFFCFLHEHVFLRFSLRQYIKREMFFKNQRLHLICEKIVCKAIFLLTFGII